MEALKITLIVTTYNWPEALRISLESALKQTKMPYEIIVADDGSGESTLELVKSIARKAPIEVVHSWQEDKGFRLAKSRNMAIAKARGDYIILVDGDIILERHFIADHCKFVQDNCFVQGTRVLLGRDTSAVVLREKVANISIRTPDVQNRKNGVRSILLAKLFSFKSTRLKGVKTCNFAFWKRDALKINGFNEEFIGWGREDSEFVARLLNLGVIRQNVKFYALGYHLFHPINKRERLAINDNILRKTIVEKKVWCDRGLQHHLQ